MNNQIDLGAIYGIENPVNQPVSIPNTVGFPNIPSLEQIAAYNVASLGIQPAQNAGLAPNVNNLPTASTDMTQGINTGQYVDTNFSQDDFAVTPTTALMDASSEMSQQQINTAITDFSNPYPVTAESIQYLNGFIRTQIGRRAEIEFLLGSSGLTTRTGYILGVGANYILINELDTNDITACDFYNIKFIKFFY